MSQYRRLLLAAATVVVAIGTGGCNKPPEVATTIPAASPSVANVSGIGVTEHVKTFLHQAESLKDADITVVTSKGDVRLIGMLDTQAQIDEAMRIARAADGAHSVHDELTIKK